MKWLRNLPVQHKLTIIIMATSTIVLLVVAAAFVYYEAVLFRRHLSQQMLSQAGIIAASSRLPLHFNDSQSTQEALTALKSEPHIVMGMTFNQADRAVAYYVRPGESIARQSATGKEIGEELPHILARGEPVEIFRHGYLDVVVPILNSGEKIGAVYLRSDLNALYAQLTNFAFVALGILAGAFLIASLLSVNLQHFISGPLLHLVQTMEAVAQRNDFTLRAKKQTDDEIGVLIARFNAMLAQLQSRDEALAVHRHNLEQQVRERTFELQNANEQLNVAVRELAKARDAAQLANEAKSLFLANMSHEIRTPMVGILGMSELLLRSGLQHPQHEMAATVLRSGEALLNILNDILDFSKIEAGKLRMEAIRFELKDPVADAISLLAEKAGAKGLALSLDLAPELPPAVVGDPGRLRQIVLNLVSNAIKFTEKGEVAVRATLLGEEPGGLRIRFEVADTGIGIDPEAQKHIFDSFSQADNATARRFGGTGLGLAIVRELVHLMGGAIGVASAPECGSTFWFTLLLGRAPLLSGDNQPRPPTALLRPFLPTGRETGAVAEA